MVSLTFRPFHQPVAQPASRAYPVNHQPLGFSFANRRAAPRPEIMSLVELDVDMWSQKHNSFSFFFWLRKHYKSKRASSWDHKSFFQLTETLLMIKKLSNTLSDPSKLIMHSYFYILFEFASLQYVSSQQSLKFKWTSWIISASRAALHLRNDCITITGIYKNWGETDLLFTGPDLGASPE